MAGIVDAMRDILSKLATVTVTNNDNSIVNPYIRVWNNQLNMDIAGNIESFPKPAFFLEVVSPATYEIIGQGFRSCDVNFRIHIIHEYYNDADGVTFEQDLKVFDYRDQILALLTYFTPAGCGAMTCVTEDQDPNHTNLYHLTLDFVCNFTDSKASRLDPARDYFTQSVPPTLLEVDALRMAQQDAQSIQFKQTFIIPQTNQP